MMKTRFAVGLAAAAVTGMLIPGAAAWATTVPSSIGTVTAEQKTAANGGLYCDDFGADLNIVVAGGLANTVYSATFTAFDLTAPYHAEVTQTFTTDAAGNGGIHPLNTVTQTGSGIGTATASVSVAGTTVTASFPIYCPGNKGD